MTTQASLWTGRAELNSNEVGLRLSVRWGIGAIRMLLLWVEIKTTISIKPKIVMREMINGDIRINRETFWGIGKRSIIR